MKLKIYQIFYNSIVNILRLKLGLKSKEIVVDGYRVSYLSRVKEFNKTLIFMHGLNDDKYTFLPLIKELGKDFNVISIDLLGCGDSDIVRDFDYTLQNQANFSAKIIEAITIQKGVKQFTLVGHSMGGGVAIYLSRALELEKLILLAPLAINIKEPYVQKLAKKLGSIDKVPFLHVCSKERLDELIEILYEKKPKIPNFIKELIVYKKCKLAEFEKHKINSIVSDDLEFKDNLTEVVKKITTPTFIGWGISDNVLDIANAKVLNNLIKESTLKTYKCGHMLQLENTKELAKDITTFLA